MTVEDAMLILDGISDCCECTGDDNMAKRLEAVQMAKEVLGMRVPKKPLSDKRGNHYCPTCGYAVIYKNKWGGNKWVGGRHIPHCETCGQAIDWEDIANDNR